MVCRSSPSACSPQNWRRYVKPSPVQSQKVANDDAARYPELYDAIESFLTDGGAFLRRSCTASITRCTRWRAHNRQSRPGRSGGEPE